MPLYEYECRNCGTKFEVLRSFSQADDPTCCPHCSKESVTRLPALIHAFSSGHSLSAQAGSCGSCASGNCGSCAHG
jgi:putative FmdB family regulatory protein